VPLLKVAVKKVTYLKDFEGCKDGKSCLVLGGKTSTETENMEEIYEPSVLRQYRGLTTVKVDTSFYSVKLDSEESAKNRPAD